MQQRTDLVDWQKIAPNGLVYPWWTYPFLEVLESWDLSEMRMLEFGAGLGTAWLRSKCKWVDSIESDPEWAVRAQQECERHGLLNGEVHYLPGMKIPDGMPDKKSLYFMLIPKNVRYDIISVDGIFRNECLQWALDHFKGRSGILIADNWQQDYVWISPAAEELMKPYPIHRFYQPGHTNHEGRPWNTAYWEIPA